MATKNIPQTLKQILKENQNHSKIKETLKLVCETKEKIVYHALVSSSETYLHVQGLANHNYDEFNYINKLLHSKIVGVVGKIKRKQLHVRDFHQEYLESKQREKQDSAHQEIIAEIQHVINNIDLPISLYKRNDKYWYPDNPNTIEAKKFVQERRKQQRERKKARRLEEQKKRQNWEKHQMQEMEKNRKLQEQRKKQKKLSLEKKLQDLKKAKQQRQKKIQESKKFGSSLKPLFRKIESEQNTNHFKALQDQKKRLSQIRKLHQSIDLTEIQERKKKFDELSKSRERKKIIDEPLKVHFKSKYHTSMANRSYASEYETTASLYDKKKQYGQIVRQQFKPQINLELVKEMQERLKLMKRKRTRKNPKKKVNKDSEDEEQDSQEEGVQSQVKQPSQKNYGQEDSDIDSDEESSAPKRIRGQDQDPDHRERYEMGVQYLEYVRNLRKKKREENTAKTLAQKQEQQRISRYQKGNGGHQSHYKDYLRQFVQPAARNTIDHIDISRIKMQNTKNNMGTDYMRKNKLQNSARTIEAKARNQEQLLKFKKMGNQEAIEKKVEIDDAVIETIKARLAMMG